MPRSLFLSSGALRVALCATALTVLALQVARAQQATPVFGGGYASLEPRRQALVQNWVERFTATTGQKMEVGPFYDEVVTFSTKTTFDAVTHALMTTTLTDQAGASLGDGLALVERVESVHGQVAGAPGDSQFRVYVRLTPAARDVLERSKEFKRGADNTVFHKGYPISFRGQGGVPSIQVSMALDGRRADVDVDYRSSSIPAALFNGHLSSSNSDIRAGKNYGLHANRWNGLQDWWQGFFGVSMGGKAPDVETPNSPLALPKTPRAGKKNIEVMVNDFLSAWLVEGNVVAAMGYVSERSYACLAMDLDNPSDFDRGIAPYQLMTNMKAAYETLGKHSSLKGLAVGFPLARPELKVVTQPHQAEFVIYSVPDDVAAAFDCESRLAPGDPKKVKRSYGNYFGATLSVGPKATPIALLWAKDSGYWKIVSWHAGIEEPKAPALEPLSAVAIVRIPADESLVQAARGFLDTWLIRRDYERAIGYLSPKSYGCYDLVRSSDQPASTSPADAGQKIRAGLQRTSEMAGKARALDAVISAADPIVQSVRVMNHPDERTFSLTSMPNALGDAVECAARLRGDAPPQPMPLEYGSAFGMMIRFLTKGGEAPVLKMLWRQEAGNWRITSYEVELP